MSTFESGFESLLQGVSQQIPRMRLPGQHTAIINALTDPVTNWRRRPGAEHVYAVNSATATKDSVKAWEVDLGGQRVHVLLETIEGSLTVLSDSFTILANFTHPYLINTFARRVKAAVAGNEMFFANVDAMPVMGAGSASMSPARRGFMYVLAGAFSKQFDITVTTNLGSTVGTYTTPDATTAGAAANSTPENIAANLVNSLTANGIVAAGVDVFRVGPYIYLQANTGTVTSLVVSSSAGSTYTTSSGASRVRFESNLPANLPFQAHGYIMAVGQTLLTYYRYDADKVAWLESGDYQSPLTLENMPISLRYDVGTLTWQLVSEVFEGRLSGDDEQNPLPEFMRSGITGIGSYQGRLVLLAGSQVCLSSSKVMRRFMRSTVTGILDDDPISVGSGANASAIYEYAIAFQKDLLLFSSKYQALIPGSANAITPRTATVLVTSTFSGDMSSEPLPLGRTLLYPTPLSADFYGLLEMISSQYSDSQYVSNPATEHLPKYMAGKCKFSASSSVASIALFGQSNDLKGVIVYQYLWSGDEQMQRSWHRWSFTYDLAYSYFSGESINLLMVGGGLIVGSRVDPKAGVMATESNRKPYLDMYAPIVVTDRQFTVPSWLRTFDPAIGDKMKLCQASGELAGEEVGIESYNPMTGVGVTVRSYTSGTVYVGVPYVSLFSPTVPEAKDEKGIKIDTNKLTVRQFGITTQNSAEYQVSLRDAQDDGEGDVFTPGTLRWCSGELDLGFSRTAGIARSIVPARTNADTTDLQIFTDGMGEMNIIGIDYSCRYNQKIRRR